MYLIMCPFVTLMYFLSIMNDLKHVSMSTLSNSFLSQRIIKINWINILNYKHKAIKMWMFQNAAFNILRPRQDGQHLADDIFKFMFVNGEVAVTIKCIEFLFLMVHLTVIQQWFRWWLAAEQATNHYLDQWWSSSLTPICAIRPEWVNWEVQSSAPS